MRARKMNGYVGEMKSSFLSCEKDTETIIKKLFVDSNPYSDYLKRLLVINTKDCIDDLQNPAYIEKIKSMSVADLRNEGYIKLEPKFLFSENDERKTFILITYDNFYTNPSNPEYRDCTIMIDILCHPDYWDIGDYRLRPFKIAGYIDGILNHTRLTGIGELEFLGCNELVISENLSGYCLTYAAIHGVDDLLEEVDSDE